MKLEHKLNIGMAAATLGTIALAVFWPGNQSVVPIGSDPGLTGASTFFAQNASIQGDLAFFGDLRPDNANCSNGEILKKTAADNWDCASDNAGGGASSNSLDFDEFVNSMTLDANLVVSSGSGPYTTTWHGGFFLQDNASVSGNFEVAGTLLGAGAYFGGNVGIQANGNEAVLEVGGAASISSTLNVLGNAFLNANASVSGNFELDGSASISASTGLLITSNGLPSPRQVMHIYTPSSTVARFAVQSATTYMSFGADTGGGPFYMWNSGQSLRFATSSDTSGTGFSAKMYITSEGRVGIATSGPNAVLGVAGSGHFSGELITADALQAGNTSSAAYNRFGAGTAGHSEVNSVVDVLFSNETEFNGIAFFDGNASAALGFEVAGYLKIPVAAGGPTIDESSKIGIDTASGSFNFHDGTREVPIGPWDKCVAQSLAGSDLTAKNQWTIFTADDPYTIGLVQYTASGTNSLTWDLKVGSATVPATNVFAASPKASGAAIVKRTSFSSAAVSDGTKLDIQVSSTSAVLDSVYVRVCMRKTP